MCGRSGSTTGATMIEHTSGPWVVRGENTPECLCVTDHDAKYIVHSFALPRDRLHAQKVADAFLIAAAPEMLALLAEILPVLEADLTVADCDQVRDEFSDLIARTSALMAKARGTLT